MARVISTKRVPEGKSVKPPTAPTYADSNFIRWWPDTYKCVTSNQDIFTEYELKRYTVTFIYGSEIIDTQEGVAYGTNAIPPQSMAYREGYNFIWDDNYKNVTSDRTVNGNYYRKDGVFIVKFYNFYKSLVSTQYVNAGSSAVPPTVAIEFQDQTTKKYYSFRSWSPSYQNIRKDTDVYSVYDEKIMKIKFVVSEKKNGQNSREVEFDIDDSRKSIKVYDKKQHINQTQFPELTGFIQSVTDSSNAVTTLQDQCFFNPTTGSNRWAGCALKSVIFNGVKTIGQECFKNCELLASVNFPSVENIGQNAFRGCDVLTEFKSDSLTSVAVYAFGGCAKLNTLEIPNIQEIGQNAFNGCKKITSFSSDKLKHVYDSAFYNCNSITTLNIPNATDIEYRGFCNCKELTSINIQGAVKIGSQAFQCSGGKLTEINLKNATSIAKDSFSGHGNVLTLTLKSELKTTCANALKCLFGMGSYDAKKDTAVNTKKKQVSITWV